MAKQRRAETGRFIGFFLHWAKAVLLAAFREKQGSAERQRLRIVVIRPVKIARKLRTVNVKELATHV
jgi:hypothetical protein